MAQVSESWWLEHESYKYMLAILVHNDKKDILSNPITLPPCSTQSVTRKNKAQVLADEWATAKMEHPVEKNSDIGYQIKKAWVNGMRSQVEKNLVESIVTQINVMQQNEQIYKSMLGKTKCHEKIIQFMNKLPGLTTTDKMAETVNMTKNDDDDNNLRDGDDISS